MNSNDQLADQAAELLQSLIRNECVNEGSGGSAHERRSVDDLVSMLEGPGLDLQRLTAEADRDNLVARIEGSDPSAPSLLIHSHTDVAPVNPDAWEHDPFGGELIDGEVWGRGSLDLLNNTATAAVAMRALADRGFRPRGDLVFVAAADHEGQGRLGVDWLHDHHPDAVRADMVLAGSGAPPTPGADGLVLPVTVANKGQHHFVAAISSRADSVPFARVGGTMARAGDAISRLGSYRALPQVTEILHELTAALGWFDSVPLTPDGLDEMLSMLPVDVATALGAGVRLEITVANIRPTTGPGTMTPSVELEIIVNTLPGQTAQDAATAIQEAAGDLLDDVRLVHSHEGTCSTWPSPLWDSLDRALTSIHPKARLAPAARVRYADAARYRAAGADVMSAGAFSVHLTAGDFMERACRANERIDVESLGLTTKLWIDVALDLLGP